MAARHGNNLTQVKKQNLASILTMIYRQAPLSRAEIAEQMELTPPTVSNIVSELMERGLVQEMPGTTLHAAGRSVGRRPTAIDLIPDSRLVLGFSLGRDMTRCCLTDLRGHILMQETYELMSPDYDVMIHQLQGILSIMLRKIGRDAEKLLGVGICIPGVVNSHTGVLKNHGTERISWRNQPLGETISRFVGLPVRVENNVRARACAVSLFHPELLGSNENFAFCHVFWGIACPMMLGTAPFHGEDAAAGEIGKMVIDPNGPVLPDCGAPGSLESLASARAILAQCQQAMQEGRAPKLLSLCKKPERLELGHVLEAEEKGDPVVCEIMDRAMGFLGIALANMVDLINPHLIFLSGEIFRVERNVQTVDSALRKVAFVAQDDLLQLVPVYLGDFGGALGAAACCIEKHLIRG